MNLKVIVTGASGFLGARVVHALARRPGVDSLGVSRREVPGMLRVGDYSQTPAADVLVHLAEDNNRAHVVEAGLAYEEKVRATLHALLEKGYRRVIYASSSVLYGDADAHAHSPSDPIQINDAYARVKRGAEVAVLASGSGVVVRLANLYGSGMARGNVMSTILSQVSGTGSLHVMDTSPVRDFLWVDDAADAIATLATMESCPTGIINLGTGVGTSIGELANMALEIAGQSGREVVSDGQSNRQSTLILDHSDTFRACGWRPRTSLRQGLACLLDTRQQTI